MPAGACSTTPSTGVPFAWRGDRTGVWATAPVAGALGALVLVRRPRLLRAPRPALLPLGAAAYTALIAWSEARYERAIYLDLTVLELRFERITDTRAPVKGSDPSTLRSDGAEPKDLLRGLTP